MGGHIVQGHVDGTGRLAGLEPIANADDFWLLIDVPEELEKYLVFKGSIAVEGISLTVAKLEGLRLTVAIIPHTIKMTNLASLEAGRPGESRDRHRCEISGEVDQARRERGRVDRGTPGSERILASSAK